MTGALELRRVVASYDSSVILDELSVQFAPGEVVAVAGDPGFGGSTLLRVIAGLRRCRAGDVLIDGRVVTTEPPALRRVGYLPAGGGLLPQLSAGRNIHYARFTAGQSWYREHHLVNRRIEALVVELGIARLLTQPADELSPGQRFRVAAVRALARNPLVVAVDATAGAEPVAGMRQLLSAGLRALLRISHEPESVDRPSSVIVFATNDAGLVATTDRLVVLAGGRVCADGSPERLRRTTPNLLTARMVYGRGLAVFDAELTEDGLSGPIPLPRPPDIDGRGPVRVAVPADALELVPGDDGIPARVLPDPAAPAGQVMVSPEADGGQRWLVHAARGPYRAGTRVRVDVHADRLLLFQPSGAPDGGSRLGLTVAGRP